MQRGEQERACEFRQRWFFRGLHDERDAEIAFTHGAELHMHPVPGVGRQLVLDPLPAVAVSLPLVEQRAVQRAVDQRVRVHRRIRAARTAHEIPQPLTRERHVRRAQRLLGALPSAELAVILRNIFHRERFPRGIAHGCGAHGDSEQRLVGTAAENRIACAQRTRAEAEAILHPRRRSNARVVGDDLLGRKFQHGGHSALFHV